MTKKPVSPGKAAAPIAEGKGRRKSRPTTSTERAREHLERLEQKKGRRLLVDLDESGAAALEVLAEHGYGTTNREIVQAALIAASKPYRKR